MSDNSCDLQCGVGFHGSDSSISCSVTGTSTGTGTGTLSNTPTCTACVGQKGCAVSKSNCAPTVAGGTKLECLTAAPGYYIQGEMVRVTMCAVDEHVNDR